MVCSITSGLVLRCARRFAKPRKTPLLEVEKGHPNPEKPHPLETGKGCKKSDKKGGLPKVCKLNVGKGGLDLECGNCEEGALESRICDEKWQRFAKCVASLPVPCYQGAAFALSFWGLGLPYHNPRTRKHPIEAVNGPALEIGQRQRFCARGGIPSREGSVAILENHRGRLDAKRCHLIESMQHLRPGFALGVSYRHVDHEMASRNPCCSSVWTPLKNRDSSLRLSQAV